MPDKTKFRLATFNVENLFARYRFRQNADVYAPDGFSINQLAFDVYDETDKRITAQAIRALDADILCLQEVESLPVLDRFKSQYLPRAGYDHRILIDCFDPRHIDVAVLSRLPITRVRTHRHERNEKHASLFSRDCLEVDVEVAAGKTFTVYVNHFKSMMGGRDATHERRVEQVQRVAAILHERHGAKLEGNYAVVGDFNDYLDGKTSLGALVRNELLCNVAEGIADAEERWTHYWASGGEYRQLDYILLPRALWNAAGKPVPEIMRKGLPWRAEKYGGERFADVGESEPKASDHCPVVIEVPVAALT